MSQWVSPPAIHTYRGKGYPHRCELCGWQLQEGQAYERYVTRVGNGRRSHFMVMVRHYDEVDCIDYQEEMDEQMAPIAATVQQVVTSKQVLSIGVNGEIITESIPVIEPIVTADAITAEPYISPDGDRDEIPS